MSNDTTAKIGEVLPSEDPGRQEERRCEVRRPYPAIQFVAFHDDSQTPTKEMFQAVRCRDISTCGISFYYPGPATADYCTIVLGQKPAIVFIKAKVVRYRPYLGPNQEWVIGCAFLSKVKRPF
jgi:hypothetical protein